MRDIRFDKEALDRASRSLSGEVRAGLEDLLRVINWMQGLVEEMRAEEDLIEAALHRYHHLASEVATARDDVIGSRERLRKGVAEKEGLVEQG